MFEMRLDVVRQGSTSDLEIVMFDLHKKADAGKLRITTPYANLKSVIKCMIYRQLIYAHPITKQQNSEQGDYIIIACLLLVVIFISLVVIAAWKNIT
jgi:hypothetical protein